MVTFAVNPELVWDGIGAFAFGLVIGWVTYFTVRHEKQHAISDIAAVIGAVGGAAVLALFPARSVLFTAYTIGLACGFFIYVGLFMVLAFAALGLRSGLKAVLFGRGSTLGGIPISNPLLIHFPKRILPYLREEADMESLLAEEPDIERQSPG